MSRCGLELFLISRVRAGVRTILCTRQCNLLQAWSNTNCQAGSKMFLLYKWWVCYTAGIPCVLLGSQNSENSLNHSWLRDDVGLWWFTQKSKGRKPGFTVSVGPDINYYRRDISSPHSPIPKTRTLMTQCQEMPSEHKSGSLGYKH